MRHLTRLDHRHHGGLARHRRNGEAITHRLGIGGEISFDAKIFLRTAARQAKPSLYFIEDQHDALLVTKGANPL